MQLEQLQAEQDKLSDIIRHQNLSPEEVIQMNAEHEALSRNLEDLKQKISETQRSVMSLEVNVANRVAAAEEALDAYNSLLSSVGLFPPLPPPLEDVDLTLELNPAAANPAQLLVGADIRKVIKPTLSRIAESKRLQRAEVESERIKIDNELDQLVALCENLEEDINQTEKKVATINEQAEDLREVRGFSSLLGPGLRYTLLILFRLRSRKPRSVMLRLHGWNVSWLKLEMPRSPTGWV